MKLENDVATRTIHPETLKEISLEIAIVMLGVARDLRDGTIKPENYNQRTACGSSCCIYGHTAHRLTKEKHAELRGAWQSYNGSRGLNNLFYGHHPSNPLLAADAIERYIYDHDQKPWRYKGVH